WRSCWHRLAERSNEIEAVADWGRRSLQRSPPFVAGTLQPDECEQSHTAYRTVFPIWPRQRNRDRVSADLLPPRAIESWAAASPNEGHGPLRPSAARRAACRRTPSDGPRRSDNRPVPSPFCCSSEKSFALRPLTGRFLAAAFLLRDGRQPTYK